MNRLCCMRLNTAGVVIGSIGSVFSLISSILIIIGFCRIDDVVKAIANSINEDDNFTDKDLRRGLIVVFSVYLAVNVINLFASKLLVSGTIKERHLMLVPWLINSGLSLFFYLACLVYISVTGSAMKVSIGSIFAFMLIAGICFAFLFIIWYTIYSLYKKLQQVGDRQRLL